MGILEFGIFWDQFAVGNWFLGGFRDLVGIRVGDFKV